MPKFEYDNCTLEYQIGDSLELMKELPDESIDLVLTDIPFNVGFDYGETSNDNMTNDDYREWFEPIIMEMERVIDNGKPVIVFTGDKNIHPIMDAIGTTDLTFHHFIKWHKPGGQRALAGFVLFYRTELAFLLTKGKPTQKILNRKEFYSDTIIMNNTKPNDKDAVNHPARRPTDLYKQFVLGFTKVGDIVLDPFLGSGTTLLACRKTGRNGIGYEINPDYEPIIRKRIMADQKTVFSF
jgi:DNA modification methylase